MRVNPVYPLIVWIRIKRILELTEFKIKPQNPFWKFSNSENSDSDILQLTEFKIKPQNPFW